ncbi:MAG: isoamylase early set domain-containing protein [Streptosporangiaceae bacterium]|jgi:hypothetical protein
MDTTGPRDVAKQQYANVRRSLTDFEEHVVARYWDEDALARTSFERLLGSLDRFAGWLLADDEIARRGQDLMRQTRYPAAHREVESRGDIAGDQEEEQVGLADTGRGAAQLSMPDQPTAKASLVDITFTLPVEVQADTVALCGEFNQWSVGDIQLERDSDGVWRAVVALEPGRSYRYRYLLDGERWENASNADQYVANPFGSVDSVISVAPQLAGGIAETRELCRWPGEVTELGAQEFGHGLKLASSFFEFGEFVL